MLEKGTFNIAVAQSGGPTAAINSSLAGVFRKASQYPEIGKIYGSINGIEGMIEGNLTPLDSILTSDYDIELLKTAGDPVEIDRVHVFQSRDMAKGDKFYFENFSFKHIFICFRRIMCYINH